MTDRPYLNTPTAILLREMHASGLSWRAIAAQIGYQHTTVYNVGTGRDRAGPALVRDVASMYEQRVIA
jgi:hypothetical protein